jgi:hypothetical protein
MFSSGSRGHHRMGFGFQLPVQSVPIITNVVSYNPAQERCTRYNIKFVSDLRQISGFLRVLRFPPGIQPTATISLKYC